jgi:succinoglycan biosynthesis protein ExoM
VVFGPVPSLLPHNTPRWLKASGLFDRRRSPTGTPRSVGGAGNVLLCVDTLRRFGRGFDPAFGKTGGEDTEFFHALHLWGARMVWCDEAVAVETVTPERARLGWILRRNYNAGRIYARVTLPCQPVWLAVASLLRCAAGLLPLALATPLALVAGRHVAARLLARLCRGLGRLSAFSAAFRTLEACA